MLDNLITLLCVVYLHSSWSSSQIIDLSTLFEHITTTR